MNSEYILSAELIGQQYFNDTDLRKHLPRYPKLIPELLFFPHGQNGFLVMGTRTVRVISSSQGRQKLQRVISQIDGTKTINQLENSVKADIEGGVFGVICLLYRYGFIEESLSSKKQFNFTPDLESYCGRYLDTTRFNSSREEALENLAQARIGLIAPPCTHELLKLTLEESGVEQYTFITTIEECNNSNCTHVLYVNVDQNQSDYELLDNLFDQNVSIFLTSVGDKRIRLGPLVIPNVSASHRCVDAQLKSNVSQLVDVETLNYWSVYALHEFTQLILRISAESYINRTVEHYVDGSSRYPEIIKVARVPGGLKSGLESKAVLSEAAFYAWLHHCAIRIPPIQYLSPQSHQSHYTVKNLISYGASLPKLHSEDQVVLPERLILPTKLPWLTPEIDSKAIDIHHISQLLKVSVGHIHIDDENVRRIAPTGGGLQSPHFVCLFFGVDGIKDGVYSYDGTSHTLESINVSDIDELRLCLDPFVSYAPFSIISIAYLERVRQKYGDFGFNIAHFDAGVATCYALQVSKSFGWKSRVHTQFDGLHIAKMLKMPTNDYSELLTSVMHFYTDNALSDYSPVKNKNETTEGMVELSRRLSPISNRTTNNSLSQQLDPTALYTLDYKTTLLTRRASQVFSKRLIENNKLNQIVQSAYHHSQELQLQGALPIRIKPWVLLPQGNDELKSGIYETHPDGLSAWKCRSQVFGVKQMRDCINQSAFAQAAAIIVYFVDLEHLLESSGAAGYRQSLLQCGSLVAHSWLCATSMGFVGSAVGGIIEAGLKTYTNIDCFSQTPMLSFAFGYEPEKEE